MANKNLEALAGLLAAAYQAHARFEADVLRGTDPDWPGWYADWLIDNEIDSMLGRSISRDDLRLRLTELDQTYQAAQSADNWSTYYASVLLEQEV